MSNNKYQFKGTPGPWHAIEYSGFYDIHDQPFYNAKRLTSYDEDVFEGSAVSEKRAKANAELMAAAPDLLEALVRVYNMAKECDLLESLGEEEHGYMQAAIHKALNIEAETA